MLGVEKMTFDEVEARKAAMRAKKQADEVARDCVKCGARCQPYAIRVCPKCGRRFCKNCYPSRMKGECRPCIEEAIGIHIADDIDAED